MMDIKTIIRAQSIDSFAAAIFATVPIFELVDGLKSRYNFRHTPTGAELINPPPNQPNNFLWGKCNLNGLEITIESLQIQNLPGLATTVSVTTRTRTDDSDAVLKDLAQWATSAFSVRSAHVFPTQYVSQLEFELDRAISEQLKLLSPVCDLITKRVRSYGFTACPSYEPSAVYLFYDNSRLTSPPTLATNFIVDRRAGVPYAENIYYSQAPLKTKDHVAALVELDRVLKEG
ncbi:MAG TPA: hypothetical protein VK302_01075 [Terriglobales bacterium]|nr:hypothetical protein [Terriglobales bacterium]